jgi:predicted ATPase
MNDVQVIVETHSDHILNGIRVAVKENEISKEKVGIFYFERVVAADEQYSKITDISVDKTGELSSYPKDMLDEWNNQLFNLM